MTSYGFLEGGERRAWLAEVASAKADPGHWIWTHARTSLELAIDRSFADARIPDYRIDTVYLDADLIAAAYSYRRFLRRRTGRADIHTCELQRYFRRMQGWAEPGPAPSGMTTSDPGHENSLGQQR